MSGTVTLEFLAGQQTRILEELANMRADHAVLLAMVQRMDATMTGLLGEVRAFAWPDRPTRLSRHAIRGS